MDKYQKLIQALYENTEKKWHILPRELYTNARSNNYNGSNILEMYYTTDNNQTIEDYPDMTDIKIIIVGRYSWDYYFDEDHFEIRDGFFITLATLRHPYEKFDPSDVISIDDNQIEPIYIGVPIRFLSIEILFNKAKEDSLDIDSFINDFI